MKYILSVVLLLALIAIAESRWHGHHRHHRHRHLEKLHSKQRERDHTSRNMEWDFFMLVTEWPFSSCEKENATHQHECVIPDIVDGWVLHGLWPSCNNGKYPATCTQEKFDFSKVEDLNDRLMKYWPNLFADESKTSFWKHEYEKHGTCAETVQGFETEHDFFKVTLDLRDKYDMGRVLSDQGITPRVIPYKGADVKKAIDNGLTKKGCATCQKVKGVDGYVLMSTTVCLSKSLQLIDCPYCEQECYDNDAVYYQPMN